jgi:hypothetical protein
MRVLILASTLLSGIFSGLLIIAPLAQAQAATGPAPFSCKVSTAHGSLTLKPLSINENYMQSAQFQGLDINTYQNEDGLSYSVTVSKSKMILAQADIIMYADTSLKLNTGKEMLSIHCASTPAAAPAEIPTP